MKRIIVIQHSEAKNVVCNALFETNLFLSLFPEADGENPDRYSGEID